MIEPGNCFTAPIMADTFCCTVSREVIWSSHSPNTVNCTTRMPTAGSTTCPTATFAAATSPEQLHETNDVFLRTLLSMARAPRLGSVMRGMATVAPGNFFELVPGSDVVQQEGTAAIVAAITARDPERAAAACVELLRSQGELVIALLASRGMFRTEDAVGQ